MARVLDAEAIGAYRDDGFICPITMMSREEARHCRDQLESFEEEHGRVFSESREHAGESLTGSYRFKSHLLMKWLADMWILNQSFIHQKYGVVLLKIKSKGRLMKK